MFFFFRSCYLQAQVAPLLVPTSKIKKAQANANKVHQFSCKVIFVLK